MDTKLVNLLDLDQAEIEDIVRKQDLPVYRAAQIKRWLFLGADFDSMTDIPLKLREYLKNNYTSGRLEILSKLVSKEDGTVKYLFRVDESCIETVLMKYKYGYSICISTQKGCRMGCTFCASSKVNFAGNLNVSGLLGQIITASADMNVRIGHIVLMGIGEPLDNYDNVVAFLKRVHESDCMGISYRNISLSTCGLVDKIIKLSEEKLPITLSVSLHSPFNDERVRIMPIAKKFSLDILLNACNIYSKNTGRRITYEYALIAGVNDSVRHAMALSGLFRKKLCHINLIPINKVDGIDYDRSGNDSVEKFRSVLEKNGIAVTVRRTLGSDIEAACGQLRKKYMS